MDELLLRRNLLFLLNEENIEPIIPPTPIDPPVVTPITINAIPLIGDLNEIGNECEYFVIAITNEENRTEAYDVNIVNSEYSDNRDFIVRSPQIDIYDGLSLFIIKKGGYHNGTDGDKTVNKMVAMTGEFTIGGENVQNTKTFTIIDYESTSEHESLVRRNAPGYRKHVEFIPYSESSLSRSTTLYGLAQGAAAIENNVVKYYMKGEDAKDYPNKSITYSAAKNYIYWIRGRSYTTDYDNSGVSNLSVNVGYKYSYLNYKVAPNTLDRLKFFVLRLIKNTNENGSSDTEYYEYLQSNIQESANLRFLFTSSAESRRGYDKIYNLAKVIDVTKSGTYEIQAEMSSEADTYCYIKFFDRSLANRIVVRKNNASGQIINPTAGTELIYKQEQGTLQNGKRTVTFHVTVN